MKIFEIEQIEIGKMGEDQEPKLNFDIVDDLTAYLRNDPICYRRAVFPLLDKYKFKNIPELRKEMERVVKKCVGAYLRAYDIPYKASEVLTSRDIRTISKRVCDEETNGGHDAAQGTI
jgi:hypothetical protein